MRWSRPSRRPAGAGDRSLRGAVTRFAAIGGAGIIIVTAVCYVVSVRLAEYEALRDATVRAQGMARGIAAPLVDEGLRAGRPEDRAGLAEVMEARIAEGGVSEVVLWTGEGRVLWTSEEEHIGKEFELSDDAYVALAEQSTIAHLPDETSEHAELLYHEVGQLEVYVGAVGADGQPFLFEAYLPASRIDADRAAVLPLLLGTGVGSVVLLLALTVPFALGLARRLDESQQARAGALHRSIASWRHQRRLLAQELHDGVIQEMAVMGYGVGLLRQHPDDEEMRESLLDGLEESARRAEAALRSLALDLTPRRLEERGLWDAMSQLVRQHQVRGVDITLDFDSDVHCPDGTGILAFRTVREGLRNVVKHAHARSVRILVKRGALPDTIEVELLDDGPLPPSDHALVSGQGLRLLADTIADVGGSLRLGPGPDGGALLVAVIPYVESEPGRL